MAAPPSSELAERVAKLEAEVGALRQTVARLTEALGEPTQ
jgi:uncharacterized protein YceH (UPF0502 family)